MIKLALIFLLHSNPDTVVHFYYREMFPYNKTDTTIVDEPGKYYKKGDTIVYHHWPVGYYYKDDKLYMDHKIFTNLTKDKLMNKQDTLTDQVIVITCDSQLIKATEIYTHKEGNVWPTSFINNRTKQPIHNICQVEDWHLLWRQDKEQRIKNPVYD